MQIKMSSQRKDDQPLTAAPVQAVQLAPGDKVFTDARPVADVQRKRMEMMHNSPRLTPQRALLQRINSPGIAARGPGHAGLAGDAVQRAGNEDLLQGKTGTEAPARLAHPRDLDPNRTGLPDHLKSGIESLSGISMDHVKVHYNSQAPARLNAHAYAQGSDIHLAPGQEQHLPHEAWHVVQQAQGRVKPTMQMKGAMVNDDVGLEREADVMGARALGAGSMGRLNDETAETSEPARALASQCKATDRAPLLSTSRMAGSQPMQLAPYLKSIQNPLDMGNEVLRLTHASPLDNNTFGGDVDLGWATRPIDLNRWLAGGAGNSTTHYNPGQNQYYSPVGYIVEVSQDRVLGNYAGDGSTSTLHSDNVRYWQAVEAIRIALRSHNDVNGAIDTNGYTAGFAAAVTDKATAIVMTGQIEQFLANAAVDADAKVEAKNIIKAQARTALIAHYSNTGNSRLGAGGPGLLAGLEPHLRGLGPGAAYHNAAQGRDNKYTESQVHAELAHVVGVFYGAELGQYPDLINAAWRMGDPGWLNNRRAAAEQFKQQFAAAGNTNVAIMMLSGGNLSHAPLSWSTRLTRGFFRWALPAVGVAMLAYASLPYLQQLFDQYNAAQPGGAE
ncbi:DUF4157 domain-containing protein [Massilia sp. CCM 9210]|uniref:eCIS core domain-containing protein n=1 Tax=Massilia scottii TaxID=3057166 RepID=UPI002796B868|nr:DUF4157 domain-containing protein [Massilia sp. CCM 9210]MDQ1814320.1 DUF4157 domain-containing protein [Massilia sp. CCM 9210]